MQPLTDYERRTCSELANDLTVAIATYPAYPQIAVLQNILLAIASGDDLPSGAPINDLLTVIGRAAVSYSGGYLNEYIRGK